MRVKMSRQRHVKGSFFVVFFKPQLKLNFLTITVFVLSLSPKRGIRALLFLCKCESQPGYNGGGSYRRHKILWRPLTSHWLYCQPARFRAYLWRLAYVHSLTMNFPAGKKKKIPSLVRCALKKWLFPICRISYTLSHKQQQWSDLQPRCSWLCKLCLRSNIARLKLNILKMYLKNYTKTCIFQR